MRQDSLPPAALWRRLAACAYDLLLVAAILMVLTGLAILARGGEAIEAGSWWYRVLLIVAWWFYFAWSWTHGGQTVGMRAWRLVVTRSDPNESVGWRQASLRFLAAGLSILPAGLGFAWSLVDKQSMTWHDRLSDSRLCYRRKPVNAAAASQSK